MRPLKSRSGFTLVEIMIVVALLGLLTIFTWPSYVSARRNSQAKIMINNIRIIQDGIDEWALDKSKADNAVPAESDLVRYLKGNRMPKIPLDSVIYQFRAISNVVTVYYDPPVPIEYKPHVPEEYHPNFGF